MTYRTDFIKEKLFIIIFNLDLVYEQVSFTFIVNSLIHRLKLYNIYLSVDQLSGWIGG